MLIALDFDGTVVKHEYPMIGEDIGAVPVLKRLQGKGHKLILSTMRSDNLLEDAKNWFRDRDIILSGINSAPGQRRWTKSPKCHANLSIDDRNLGVPLIYETPESRPYVDWVKVEKLLEERGIL